MKTAYLIRQNPWFTPTERKIARKLARDAEKQLLAQGSSPDPASAAFLYCAACALNLLARTQTHYLDTLVTGQCSTTELQALQTAQNGALNAATALETFLQARRNGQPLDLPLTQMSDAMITLALTPEAVPLESLPADTLPSAPSLPVDPVEPSDPSDSPNPSPPSPQAPRWLRRQREQEAARQARRESRKMILAPTNYGTKKPGVA